MNVITLASRKGGAGKSTLTAHLAGFAARQGQRCLLVDADPQGSLTLWHSRRSDGQPRLETAAHGIDRVLAPAMIDGCEWVFIDTAPTMWVVVKEAIRAATLVVIPARAGFFDIAAVRETAAVAHECNKPYAVVINAAPVKRDDKEMRPVVQTRAELERLAIPVWSGQISHRASYLATLAAGTSVAEAGADSAAASEITKLWTAIERSVEAINGAYAASNPVRERAA
jgi:chromosome partitioning protein